MTVIITVRNIIKEQRTFFEKRKSLNFDEYSQTYTKRPLESSLLSHERSFIVVIREQFYSSKLKLNGNMLFTCI